MIGARPPWLDGRLPLDARPGEEPFVVGDDFTLVNPDGRLFGPDLVGRSNAMRALAQGR